MSAQIAELILVICRQDPATVQNATKQLELISKQPGYLPVILGLLKDSLHTPVGQYCAVYFKSHVLNFWVPNEGDEGVISDSDKQFVRSCLVGALVAAPKLVKAQLIQALGIISHADFPGQWPGLLQSLIEQLSPDMTASVPILECLDAMFHYYRTRSESEELWSEILLVHKTLYPALQAMYKECLGKFAEFIPQAATKQAEIKLYSEALMLITNIFHSLNAQDISAFAEDNMESWFGDALQLLRVSTDVLQHTNEDEPSMMDHLHTSIVSLGCLFSSKYQNEFRPMIKQYSECVWSLLITKTIAARWDELSAECLDFVGHIVTMKDLFTPEILQAIVNSVIVPFMEVKEYSEDQFLYSPASYLSAEMDGDTTSRRGHTVSLLGSLVTYFPADITNLVKTHIEQLKTGDWRAKDQAVRLIIATTVTASTRSAGAVGMNPLMNIGQYFGEFVLPELQAGPTNPILKASCIRFISVFRSQLPPSFLPTALDILVSYLQYEEYVVHTLAATSIDQIVALNDAAEQPVVPPATLKFEALLTKLFNVLKFSDSRENDAVMSAALRILIVADNAVVSIANDLLTIVLGCVKSSIESQTNAQFTHLLFEIVAHLIKTLVTAYGEPALIQFETILFPLFELLLASQYTTEAQPYVFQLVSQLLETKQTPSAPYIALLPTLLNNLVWVNNANLNSIARLLIAFLQARTTFTNEQVSSMVAFYTKLNALSIFDHINYKLATSMFQYLAPEQVSNIISQIVKTQFQRLTAKKTEAFCEGVTLAWCVFMARFGVNTLLQCMNGLQKGVADMAVKIMVSNIMQIKGVWEKNTVIIGALALSTYLTQPGCMITDSAAFATWLYSYTLNIALTKDTAQATISVVSNVLSEVAANSSGKFSSLACGVNPMKPLYTQPLKEVIAEAVQNCNNCMNPETVKLANQLLQ